jgi:hypothetical protein
MSHFTKLDRAQITDPEAFVEACAEIGLVDVLRADSNGMVRIKDYFGKQTDVDVAVAAGKYHVALARNPDTGKYDMVADWWGVRNALAALGNREWQRARDSDLQDFLLRTTTKNSIVSRYRRKGFRAEIQEDESHNIKIRLRRA